MNMPVMKWLVVRYLEGPIGYNNNYTQLHLICNVNFLLESTITIYSETCNKGHSELLNHNNMVYRANASLAPEEPS